MGSKGNVFAISLLVAGLMMSGTAAQAAATSTTTAKAYRNDRVNLGFSGGLVTTGGVYGGVFLAGVSLPVGRYSPVRVGLDSGIIFAEGTGLPILLNITYNFDGSAGVRPYIGAAVGPVINLSSGTRTVFGYTVANPGVGSDVKLAILVKPGLRFNVAENLDIMVETAFGGLTGTFYIAPTLGIAFRV